MGMLDESWCASCGGHIEYTEDESTQCGPCEREYAVNVIESMIAWVENRKNQLEEELSMNLQGGPATEYLEGAVETATEILAELQDKYVNA